MKLVVNEEDIRLDNYLAKEMDITRSSATKIIKSGNALVNGIVVNYSFTGASYVSFIKHMNSMLSKEGV